jgi:hypothetical protein
MMLPQHGRRTDTVSLDALVTDLVDAVEWLDAEELPCVCDGDDGDIDDEAVTRVAPRLSVDVLIERASAHVIPLVIDEESLEPARTCPTIPWPRHALAHAGGGASATAAPRRRLRLVLTVGGCFAVPVLAASLAVTIVALMR